MTGTPDQRPGLQAMIEEKATYDVVVVWSTSSFGRSLVDTIELSTKVLPAVVSVTDDFDTRKQTASGKVMRTVLALFAEGFIDQLRDSVNASQTRQLEANRWPGGPTPFGLTTDDDHRLVVQDDEAAALRRMAELVIEHRGHAGKVARQLDEEGHRRPGGKTWVSRTQEVRRYMRADHLTGQTTWKGETLEYEPPILDGATLAEVRHLLDTSQPSRSAPDSGYWLTGLVLCPCGGHYVGFGRHGKGNQLRYRCSNIHIGAHSRCDYTGNGYKMPMKERMEDEVWSQLVALYKRGAEDGWDDLGTDTPYVPEVEQGVDRPVKTLTRSGTT